MQWIQADPLPEVCRCCTEPECDVCEHGLEHWLPVPAVDRDDILITGKQREGAHAMELSAVWVRAALPPRDPRGHKGDFGKVLCICGSVGYTGAPVFASRAAVRSGAGLVYLAVPEPIWAVTAVKSDEAMVFPMPAQEGRLAAAAEEPLRRHAERCDAVLLGCGLGRGEETDDLSRRLLDMPQPLVLDADGINALCGHIDRLDCRRGSVTVLTPHEGEFARIAAPEATREASAAALAARWGVYVILKGHRTVIAAPDGRMAVNPTGNSGMAKGGSGDVLAGMVTSLLGQGVPPFEACCAAVYLHGLAGDLAAGEKTERAMTPSDLVSYLPRAFEKIET